MLTRRTALKGGMVLAVANHSTVATAEPATTQEAICDRVQRLSEELSQALDQWAGGMFAAVVYPGDHPMGIEYRNVGATPLQRLEQAETAYKLAAKSVDPSATVWWAGRGVGDNPHRFSLIGSAK